MDRHKSQADFDRDLNGARAITRIEQPRRLSSFKLTPTEDMRKAKSWIERVSVPPRADETLLAMHGWLSPSGILYACGWQAHDELTRALGYSHQSEIEAAGFCKLSNLQWLVAERYRERELTADQWHTIERWYDRNGFPEEHYLRLTSKF